MAQLSSNVDGEAALAIDTSDAMQESHPPEQLVAERTVVRQTVDVHEACEILLTKLPGHTMIGTLPLSALAGTREQRLAAITRQISADKLNFPKVPAELLGEITQAKVHSPETITKMMKAKLSVAELYGIISDVVTRLHQATNGKYVVR